MGNCNETKQNKLLKKKADKKTEDIIELINSTAGYLNEKIIYEPIL